MASDSDPKAHYSRLQLHIGSENRVPLPLLCVGGAYIPLSRDSQNSSMNSTGSSVLRDDHENKGPVLSKGTFTSSAHHRLPMLKVKDKKVICIEKDSASILSQCQKDDIRLEFASPSGPVKPRRDGQSFKLTACHSGALSDSDDIKRGNFLTVPLYFALEMISSFPKSYLFVARDRNTERKKKKKKKKSKQYCFSGTDDADNMMVSTLPAMKIIQYGEKGQIPVEYQACFLTQHGLENAWKIGRRYLIAASLSARRDALKMACDAAHARAAMIASRGSPWRRPPKGENSASSFGQDEENDEDGIPEPPEVQDLAAELGMGGAGPSIPFDPSDDKPSLARDAKVFAATLACGALATCAPIVQTCSSAVDRFLASLPILDRLVLKAVPPRAPQVSRERLSNVLESINHHNTGIYTASEQDRKEPQSFPSIPQRLALSALWMGISLKLIIRQYMLGSATSILIASQATPTDSSSKKGHDPIVADVLSQLIFGSLESNDFVVKKSVEQLSSTDSHDGSPTFLDLEHVLSLHSGMSIEYDDGTKKEQEQAEHPTTPAKAILLIGDIGTNTAVTAKKKKRRNTPNTIADMLFGEFSDVPISVHDGHDLLQSNTDDEEPSS
eukprot:CAMPEP_0118799392 /NCGR_PEP_ID=MMETSP1161-20130426/1613_1 /TAXON_ID=249345 /ORGANISM="Picochlorum oklahomensis, Strain CCMP2329" /LENGTH=613 /DNA_ID=CAMNT_0006727079 /DNA_START=124 /DNA_END=1965 /DNA_ORIENTATION=+